jgi:hypothetical protein
MLNVNEASGLRITVYLLGGYFSLIAQIPSTSSGQILRFAQDGAGNC